MDGFHDLQTVLNAIARERPVLHSRYGELLDGVFEEKAANLPYHRLYVGHMNRKSMFATCELKLPRSEEATSAMVLCDLGKSVGATTGAVKKAYADRVEPVFPTPREPQGSPHYLRVGSSDGSFVVSFGYRPGSDLLSNIVIDMKLGR